MKRTRLKYAGILLTVVIAATVALGWMVLSRGFSARLEPNAAEAYIARHVRRLAIPRSARDAKNPLEASPEVLSGAMEHFADHCASCHGNDGQGRTLIGRGLYPKPPDLRQSETQNLSDGELFWIIENGVRFTGMPAFGGHGSEDDSWKLVLLIRHLPQLRDQERLEMEKMNPKGPDDRDEEQDEQDFLKGEPMQQKTPAKHH